MEIINKNPTFLEQNRYQTAKRKVRKIRDFYINLSFFCLFIPIIIAINLYYVPEFHWFWFSISGWGIGLLFHGLSTFDFKLFSLNNWEERKLQQFIKEDIKSEKLKNTQKIDYNGNN